MARFRVDFEVMLPAVTVKPRQKEIHPKITEDGGGKTDDRKPGRPSSSPTSGNSGMEEKAA